MSQHPSRLGDLDRSRFPHRGVRDELRANLIAALRRDEALFPGLIGYEESVIPQVVNALLARHDLILLGLRGQAKTRLARSLVSLLDEWTPAVAGSPLREHPLAPTLDATRRLIAEQGDDTPLTWIHRDQRYGEKLATPDVTVADLVGDVDPLKAAHQGLDLGDPEVISFGIIPRSNRGVFCINELPDLAPRIQVALFNLLEEQDFQIRGFPLRIPLDVCCVFTANPEDYTNRGAIITPLKDRIASQVTTHYPQAIDEALTISEQEAWLQREQDPRITVPGLLRRCVEAIAFAGRASEYVDQKSGVSARLSIAAHELLLSQVERRAYRLGQDHAVARLVDLHQLVPAVTGKVELVYEGEQEGPVNVARHLIGQACQQVFDEVFPTEAFDDRREDDAPNPYREVLDWFAAGHTVELADQDDEAAHAAALATVPGLDALANRYAQPADDAERHLAMELILEGLHQHGRLAKENAATGQIYGDLLRVMFESSR